jgi:IS605 OrfB family transposase
MEDLTNIRKRIKAALRVRTRYRWALRQLQDFVTDKAAEFGIATILSNAAYTSMACSQCGQIGLQMKHRF